MQKYMMATKATHLVGDISRDEPDLCVIHKETETEYIGNWVEGLGFINVRFPKETTRELTAEEVEKYHGRCIGIPGSWDYRLQIKPVTVKKPPTETVKIEVDKKRIPAGARLVECYATETEYIILGDVNSEDESHNCDEMGCGTFDHVVARFPRKAKT